MVQINTSIYLVSSSQQLIKTLHRICASDGRTFCLTKLFFCFIILYQALESLKGIWTFQKHLITTYSFQARASKLVITYIYYISCTSILAFAQYSYYLT